MVYGVKRCTKIEQHEQSHMLFIHTKKNGILDLEQYYFFAVKFVEGWLK